MSTDYALFVRGNVHDSSADVWDDTALIKAYDKAINLAKEEVSKRMAKKSDNVDYKQKKSLFQKLNHPTQKAHKKWMVSNACRAIYSEDGQFYEAKIEKIFEDTGMCTVKFIGYNNTETVQLSSLLESAGSDSILAQQNAAINEKQTMEFDESQTINGVLDNPMECETNEAKSLKNMYIPKTSFSSRTGSIPPPPPLPPQLLARLPENDADALSSMLMSWYISGFHTGYYHGLKQAQSTEQQRKK